MLANAPMIERDRSDVAAALHKAEHLGVMGAPPEANRALRLAGPRQFGFVGLNRLAAATKQIGITAGRHGQPDTMAEKPSRLHAAIQHPLDLPGCDAFLGAA